MHKDKIRYLVEQYMLGQLTEDQMDELLVLTDTPNEGALQAVIKELMEEYSASTESVDVAKRQTTLQKVLNVDKTKPGSVQTAKRLHFGRFWKVAAAAIIVLIGSGTYYMLHRTNEKPAVAAVHYKGDVQPGHNGAVLRLSNGDAIMLDSAKDGTVALQGSIRAVKINGALIYSGQSSELQYNTVSTDRGRQWHLTLPDGTKVWLNSASSIRYPLSFPGKERLVEITGEAYMEVAHNANKPFKVKAGDQVVEDIGTAFNINAYGDEQDIKTTLLEGSIRVSVRGSTRVIKPGQQTIVQNDGVNIGVNNSVNVENAIAWKNGFFAFQDNNIKEVMHQLSRWYNVDVKYEGVVSKEEFNGKIGQELTLAQVLKILEKTGVHFRIEEDKRIVILP